MTDLKQAVYQLMNASDGEHPITPPPELSPAAQAVWEAFSEDEAGVFVDYGDKLAAALRALAVRINGADAIRQDVLDIADELEGVQ